jgi:two-component system KDP operon response regulator KdpE
MAEGPVITVIDDEVQIRRLLRLGLEAHGFDIAEATTGQEGLYLIAAKHPDLVILDLGLPDMDGLEVLKTLREWSRVPVIVLSVRNAEPDKIALLDAGANDYLVKPFGMGELLARVRAVMRNTMLYGTDSGKFESGGLSVDFSQRQVSVNGEEIKLTPTEFSLLRILCQNAGKVLVHSHLIRELWGPDVQPDPSYLRVYILQLRKKIESDPSNPKLIITEPGIGYRLIID